MTEKINPISQITEKIVESFSEADLSDLKIPMIVIYQYPKDYPYECIARVFDADKPTNMIMRADCTWLLKQDIEKNTGLIYFERGAEDDQKIVGFYL